MSFGGDKFSAMNPLSKLQPFFRSDVGDLFGWNKKPDEVPAPKPPTLLTAPMVDTPGRHKTLLGA